MANREGRCDFAAGAAAPDAEAFERLWAGYFGRVLGFLIRCCPSREDAEDLAVETFVQAHGAWAQKRPGGGEIAWLLAIARQRLQLAHRVNAQHPDVAVSRLSAADGAELNDAPEADDPEWEAVDRDAV